MRKLLDFFGFNQGGDGPPKNRAKLSGSLLLLAALGAILLVIGSVRGGGGSSQPKANLKPEAFVQSQQEQAKNSMTYEEELLAKKLCEMLKKIEGAGVVEVSVRLFSSARAEYAVNTNTGKKVTQEHDQSGGSRLITEDTGSGQLVMNKGGQGSETPVVEREMAPQITGVLVVAEGAGDARVKAKLFDATRTALGIEPQKIMVVSMERGF
ncbi:MAG: hypothetical protein ACYC0Q_04880 [Eubacteriales bacterium]